MPHRARIVSGDTPQNAKECRYEKCSETERVREVTILAVLCTHCQWGHPHKMQKTVGDQPTAHARRKEERKNEKLNLSNYIVPFNY